MDQFIAVLLMVQVVALSILVPGGPVENRDFSTLPSALFWGFNVFLISLGLGTLGAAYLIFTGMNGGLIAGIIVSALFAIVYVLDLLRIFPQSQTAMSPMLARIEVNNLILAIVTIVVSFLVL
ncbi:MAG: hypothetical protein ACOCXQ_01815 [Patescibacteria group bacterium]